MSRYHQGKFTAKNPQKYAGDANNIVFRSSWEFSFMRWADATPSVLRWSSEELQIPYYLDTDRKWHRYFPDFLLTINQSSGIQTLLVEIKPHSQTKHPQTKKYASKRRMIKESLEYAKNQAKWAAADTFCKAKNWKFVILTEQELYGKINAK
jgi:hypothetical protein